MENKERHGEMSDKLFKMAEALMNEGDKSGDYIISSTGNFIMLVSDLMNNEEDMKTVGDLLAMFSAKKVLDSQMMGDGIMPGLDDLEEMFRNMKDRIENEENEDENED